DSASADFGVNDLATSDPAMADRANVPDLSVADLATPVDHTMPPDLTSACIPESDGAFCIRLGYACGTQSGLDNCGAARIVASCGSCSNNANGNACINGACGC